MSNCSCAAPPSLKWHSWGICIQEKQIMAVTLFILQVWDAIGLGLGNYKMSKASGNIKPHTMPMKNISQYSWPSLSRTRKGPENLFEIERVRNGERKIGYSLHKGTETLVRDRDRFEIEGVRDRESQLYFHFILTPNILFPPYIRLSRSGIENLLSNSLIWRLLTRFDETADLITVNPSFYCVLEWSFFISHYSTRLYCLLVLYRNFLWNSRLM